MRKIKSDKQIISMLQEKLGQAQFEPYDPLYKGFMVVLADEEGLMCGFKVHWPNNSSQHIAPPKMESI